MKERPILFSGPMVRAILENRKTQTRRIIKAPKGMIINLSSDAKATFMGEPVEHVFQCPYGIPGDRLWVRETWAITTPFNHIHYQGSVDHGPVWYRSDDSLRLDDRSRTDLIYGRGKWRPSIHMPRWASRITLEITNIRVERLKEITEVDAKAEGAKPYDNPLALEYMHTIPDWRPYSHGYRDIWESINGPGSWDANPWVWVVEFKKLL